MASLDDYRTEKWGPVGEQGESRSTITDALSDTDPVEEFFFAEVAKTHGDSACRIVRALRSEGPCSVSGIVQNTGLSYRVVREDVQALVRDSVLIFGDEWSNVDISNQTFTEITRKRSAPGQHRTGPVLNSMLKEKLHSFRIKRLESQRFVRKIICWIAFVAIIANVCRVSLGSLLGWVYSQYTQGIFTILMVVGMLLPAVADFNFNNSVQDAPCLVGYSVQIILVIMGLCFALPINGRMYQAFLLPTITAAYFLFRAEEIISQEEGYVFYSTIIVTEVCLINTAMGFTTLLRGFKLVGVPMTERSFGGGTCNAEYEWTVFLVGFCLLVIDTGIVVFLHWRQEAWGLTVSEGTFFSVFTSVFLQGKSFLIVLIMIQYEPDCVWKWLIGGTGWHATAWITATYIVVPVVLWTTQKQIYTLFNRCFEIHMRLKDGAFLAHLVVGHDPQALLVEGGKRLRCVRLCDVQVSHLRSNDEDREAEHDIIATACDVGAIDFFVCHSWRDSPEAKVKALQLVREVYVAEHGREPTIWIDKFCMHRRGVQSQVGMDLACLPVYIMACQKMLVLSGDTFASRLWCVWEMYTFFSICPHKQNRVIIASLDGSYSAHAMLSNFRLETAQCGNANDEEKLLAVIEAGGASCFENTVRGIGEQIGDYLAEQGGEEGSANLIESSIVEFEFDDLEANGVFRATAMNFATDHRGEPHEYSIDIEMVEPAA